jgi:integrase
MGELDIAPIELAELARRAGELCRHLAALNKSPPSKSEIEKSFAAQLIGKKQSSAYSDENSTSHWFRWYGHTLPAQTDILRYIDHARSSLNHSNKTIRGALVRLRRGFKPWGLYSDFTEAMRLVKTSSTPERVEIKLIPFADVPRLVNAPNRNTRIGRRDAALFALLFGGALRISEALGLKLSDVRQTPAGTMFVRLGITKAGTPAVQAIIDQFAPVILECLAFRLTEGACPDSPLITYYGKDDAPTNSHMERRNASKRIFERWCKKLGIAASPHSARATTLTKMLADGKTYREVQEFSRHASIQMVEVYDKRTFGIDDSPGRNLSFTC